MSYTQYFDEKFDWFPAPEQTSMDYKNNLTMILNWCCQPLNRLYAVMSSFTSMTAVMGIIQSLINSIHDNQFIDAVKAACFFC